jgi:hypothetical protein
MILTSKPLDYCNADALGKAGVVVVEENLDLWAFWPYHI